MKYNPEYKDELKDNGELKYSLQELMVINTILNNNEDILINIIGANQNSHVLKVNELLKDNLYIKSRFLTYEICRNADERDLNTWCEKLNKFINDNKLEIEYRDLLKYLMIITSNDIIIDYNNLDKYKNNLIRFNNIISSINNLNNNKNIQSGNDLIYKMSLVCYNLNRSIEHGNQVDFYKYILSIVNEYEKNKDKYFDIQGLYQEFLIECFDRLLNEKNVKVKELKK